MTTTHLIGLLLGTEDDWPTAFEQYLGRLAPQHRARRRDPRGGHRAGHHRALRPAPARPPRPGHRPPRLLVRPPTGVAQEDRPDGPGVPAQQPVHLPGDGEARRLLRGHPARVRRARDLAAAPQGPARERALRPHRLALQPGLRPGRGGGAGRLPDVHEAVPRRRLGQRLPHRRPRRAAGGLRRLGAGADARPGRGRGLRHLHPGPGHRPSDDGHALRPDQAPAPALPGRPRVPRPRRSVTRSSPSGPASGRSSAGSSTASR